MKQKKRKKKALQQIGSPRKLTHNRLVNVINIPVIHACVHKQAFTHTYLDLDIQIDRQTG